MSAKEYSETLGDLVKLGFIPPELEADPVKKAIVAPAIGAVLEQLSKVIDWLLRADGLRSKYLNIYK